MFTVMYGAYIYSSGQPYIYVRNYGVSMVSSLAGKLPCLRSCTVLIYSSGQPYTYVRNYGVSMVSSLAGKLPCPRSCTVLIYTVLASPIHMYVIMVYLWSHH